MIGPLKPIPHASRNSRQGDPRSAAPVISAQVVLARTSGFVIAGSPVQSLVLSPFLRFLGAGPGKARHLGLSRISGHPPVCELASTGPPSVEEGADDLATSSFPAAGPGSGGVAGRGRRADDGAGPERLLPLRLQPCRVGVLPVHIGQGLHRRRARVLPVGHQPCGRRLLRHGRPDALRPRAQRILSVRHQPRRRRVLPRPLRRATPLSRQPSACHKRAATAPSPVIP